MKHLLLILIALTAGCNMEGVEVIQLTDKIVFISQGEYTSTDIGSSANVDAICQAEADLSVLTQSKTFLAFAKQSGVSYRDRADTARDAKWNNFDNTDIKNTFYLSENTPIIKDQFGVEVLSPKSWSNTDIGGNSVNAADCQSMTSISDSHSGRYFVNGIYSTETCDTASFRFICVEY